ncbi:MAG: hypothetical protein MUQ85_08165 [Flavobacteriaceae bacterium]|jgi:hypothetical protein|nr:hypothetical protein [Flavobacteriaceae bacterium]MDO7603893.1 hypothetical protein [Flavobacteriaceae bacterium]|tara:strand:- start:38 stop:286 length:249 start_codon:yes stop_codon:yes gene_type:complete
MRSNEPDDFDSLKISVGAELKKMRISAGYRSYEVFAWDNKISRIQYWKMEKGTNCTLKSLKKVLDVHKIRMDVFFSSLFLSG